MENPFNGGNITLKHEKRSSFFRNEKFEYEHIFYHCVDTNEDFTTTQLDEVNIAQVYNQYRVKHGIPFANEIKNIRAKYGFSASKMSRVLGFGENTYRLYENGDMPSVANGKTLMAIKDTSVFMRYIEDAKDEISIDDYNRVSSLNTSEYTIEKYKHLLVFGDIKRGKENGFTEQSLSKLKNVLLFFIEKMNGVFVTKMNKLLFYTDFVSYREQGQAITGLGYKAIQYGPVPMNWDKVYGMIDDIEQEIIEYKNGNSGQNLISKLTFDENSLTDNEIKILERVYKRFKDCSSNDISSISHKEKAWQENERNHQLIDFNYAFSLIAM